MANVSHNDLHLVRMHNYSSHHKRKMAHAEVNK